MNDLVQISVASYSSTLARDLRYGEGRQIEGSWHRVGERACLVAVPPVAKYARTALLVWGTVSIAAAFGAALVYAHAGSRPQNALNATAAISAGARELTTAAAAARGKETKSAAESPMALATTAAAAAGEPIAGASARSIPSPKPPVVAAVSVQPFIETAAVEPLAEKRDGPIAEARLPRPRPRQSELADASIERQWRALRAALHAGYQPLRPRLVYRYPIAPL